MRRLSVESLGNPLIILAVFLAMTATDIAAQTRADYVAGTQAAVVPVRITRAIDDSQRVRLIGNVHPLAKPEFDQGLVDDATPMSRMLLVLRDRYQFSVGHWSRAVAPRFLAWLA
jgi:hypothetical protein